MNRLLIPALLIVATAMLIAPALGDGPGAGEATPAAEEVVADAPQPYEPHEPGDVMVIPRDGSGQFHVDADLGGTAVSFLVDTGADLVALSMDDAQRLGIAPDPGAFAPILRTASGMGYGAPVRIERLTVADHELEDVDAVVVRGLPVSLLGQSALRRLGRVTLEGDRLLIAG
ncbi:MAG: hypothetical protein RIS94_1293 [Pseudomonadota bacterium]|jgi:aspartyl protease family protein